ncbi:MAG: PEGA domain-containing protein [Magnetococcales bacterium]|nr:PEGA domain-containing protein [Magnetococcales bacterium]
MEENRLEQQNSSSSSWSGWMGWGVAVVVVLAAGPGLMERWFVKGGVSSATLQVDQGSSVPPVMPLLGTIHAVSEPIGAGVLMDGRFVGVTPIRFHWTAGSVTLTLKKNGFQDLIAPVQVEMAKEVDFRVTMLPETLKTAALPATSPPPVVSQEQKKSEEASQEIKPEEEVKKVEETKIIDEPKIDPPVNQKVKTKQPAKEKVEKIPVQNETEPVVDGLEDVRKNHMDPALTPLVRQADSKQSDQLDFAYSIQIAAFLDRDSAIRNAAIWRAKGYDAYVLELWGVKDPTRLWQSVRVGRFNDLAQARVALEALRKQEKVKGFYVARRDSFTPPEGAPPVKDAKIILMTGPTNTGKAVSEPSSQADTVPTEQKVVEAQPVNSTTSVKPVESTGTVEQVIKEVLPEQSAWVNDDLRVQKMTPQPKAAESKSPPEKKRPAQKPPSDSPQEPVKVSMEQASLAERTFMNSFDKKESGDLEGEEAVLQQVLKIDPGHIKALRRLARIMVETSRPDKALELLKNSIGGRSDSFLAEEDPNLAAFMAALYQRREEHWQAIDLYDALLKKYPNKGLWQMGIAISLEKVDESAEALRAYKKALASGDLSHKLQSFVRKRIEKL